MIKIRPRTTVAQLAKSDLLDRLNGCAILMYLRIVAASERQGRRVQLRNHELLPLTSGVGKTIRRSFEQLEDAKLIRVRHGIKGSKMTRTIELLA